MEATGPTEAVIEPPQERRERPKKLAHGELAVAALETLSGAEMPPGDKELFLAVTDDQAAAALLQARLGVDIDIHALKARSVFGGWLHSAIKLPQLFDTYHIQTIEETNALIKHCQDALASVTDPEIEAKLLKVLGQAIEAKSKMAFKAQKFAQTSGIVGPPAKPRNRPPEILVQNNIAVQNSGSVER